MSTFLKRTGLALLRLVGINPHTEAESLPYMNRVDAALARKGSIGPVFLSIGTLALVVLFLIWADFAELDEVTRGQGQVVASQRTQIIQNLEGGILREILVREGDVVERDQPLARLDNVSALSQYRDAMSRSQENEVAILRLEAEIAGVSPVYPDELRAKVPDIVREQDQLYAARREKYTSELELLESQYKQQVSEVEAGQLRKAQMERTLKLAQERLNIARALSSRKLYSKVDLLEQEQRVVTLQGDISVLASNIPKLQEAVVESRQKLELRKAELDTQISEEINKRQTEFRSLKEAISTGDDKVMRTEVTSPVRGTVKQISINTLGGVVKSGESIMEVVPLDDTLLVEARVRPADIAFVHPQQKAMVKISAYDFSIYGGLEAKVEQISADTIEDKRGEFYYLVKLRTKDKALTYRSEQLPIIPGMVATVDIVSGKKSVLSYLLKPLLKAKQNAMSER